MPIIYEFILYVGFGQHIHSLEEVCTALGTVGPVYSALYNELEQLYSDALAAHLYEAVIKSSA